jgi:hypothetical protein
MPIAEYYREKRQVCFGDSLNVLEWRGGHLSTDITHQRVFPATGRFPIDEKVKVLSQPKHAHRSVVRRKTPAETPEYSNRWKAARFLLLKKSLERTGVVPRLALARQCQQVSAHIEN